jgi:hypothetical protein
MKDLLTLTMDDPNLVDVDKEYSRGLVGGFPNVPEYRHELMVAIDTDYVAAWRFDYDPEYPAIVEANPQLMVDVLAGQTRHPYREGDPDIVRRSLLRNGWRFPEGGEGTPPDVLGRQAPKVIVTITSIAATTQIPELV